MTKDHQLTNRVTSWSPATKEEVLIALTLTADAALDLVRARRVKHPDLVYRVNGYVVAATLHCINSPPGA